MEKTIKALRIKWNGKTPRTFSLPIPFISHSDKTGEVRCDPIGEFPPEDGQRLLEMEGTRAELVETIYENGAQKEPEQKAEVKQAKPDTSSFPLCACGCEKHVAKEGNRFILGHSSKFPKAPTQQAPEAVANPT